MVVDEYGIPTSDTLFMCGSAAGQKWRMGAGFRQAPAGKHSRSSWSTKIYAISVGDAAFMKFNLSCGAYNRVCGTRKYL
ncbi:hypothetical protein [Treponema endosymbiont of Eucomonympha sp.]|uniref:hypothetical protein n=1 Tax=Treponema endosymbiont of Eucomonympha sp. TaxID=1580831 RepID=UPI00164F0D6A|nr:hypothetical protein [Treponema endosymbiont of Eucomonympha sp.]